MMKKLRTIVSAILICLLVLSLAGCGESEGSGENSAPEEEPQASEEEQQAPEEEPQASEESRLTVDALAAYAADQDAEVYEDQDAFVSTLLHPAHESGVEVIDGIMTLTGEDIETLFADGELNYALGLEMEYDPALTKTAYYYIDGWEEWGAWYFQTLAIDFESSDAAASYSEDLRAKLKAAFEDYTLRDVQVAVSEESTDEVSRTTATGKLGRVTVREGVYVQGPSVMILLIYENNSESADQVLTPFCEAFQIYDPQNDIPAEPEPEPAQEYSGNTIAYIINPINISEDTSNGYEAVIYKDMDSEPHVRIKYGAEDVYKPSCMYLYLDGVEVKVDELDERTWAYSSWLELNDEEQIANGVHTLEFIQYIDDDPNREQRFYQAVEFTIEDKPENE